MASWIIRGDAPSLTVEGNRIVIKGKRRVSIKAGDVLLLLVRGALSTASAFTDKTEVVDVAQRGLPEPPGEEKRWVEINTSGWTPLSQPVELDLFSTSLTFIQNWKRPTLHVRQAYRRLPDADFETIELGEPFLARETYLTLLNALPQRLAQTYLSETAMSPRSLQEYAERAIELLDFIQRRVITLGDELIEVQSRWESLSEQIGFQTPPALYACDENESQQPLNVSLQASAFSALRALSSDAEGSGISLAEIRGRLRQEVSSTTDRRFEILFGDRIDERP